MALAGCESVGDCADTLTCEPLASHIVPLAEAKVLGADGPFLRHPMRGARAGDVLIANDYARFYITGTPHADGYSQYAGWVIDADLNRDFHDIDYDGLDGYYPLVNIAPIAASTVSVDDGSETGIARVRVQGRCEAMPKMVLSLNGAQPHPAPVDVELTYSLGPDDRALRVDTRVTNPGDTPQAIEVGDILLLGDDESEPFTIPGGFDLGSPAQQLDVLGTSHEWRASTYAVYRPDGPLGLFDDARVRDQVGGGDSAMWGVTIGRSMLDPGESLELTRYLVVAHDIASAVTDRLARTQESSGLLRGHVYAGGEPVAGARVSLFADPELQTFISQALTGADGRFESVLAPGSYYAVATGRSNNELVAVPQRVRALSDGYVRSASRSVEVIAGEVGAVDLQLGQPAHVALRLRDNNGAGTAGKVTWIAEDERPAPLVSAGERIPYPSLGVRQVVWTPNGEAKLDMEPGLYTVVASRGFDSSVDVRHHVELRAGQMHALELLVTQVVEHPGYVAIDSHVHGTFSQHGETTAAERLITAAAEGLRVHVATDHDWVVDYGRFMPDTDLSVPLVSLPGVELTTPNGHHCMWPVTPDPSAARGGAVLWWMSGDVDAWYDGYRSRGAMVRQIAHGASYFAAAGFNPQTARVREGSAFSWDFNAMEVHNNKGSGDRARLLPIWFSLLRNGHRIAPVAASDSHSRVPEIGSARTYVAVGPDTTQLTAADVASAVSALKTVPSTGPFIDFHAQGAGRRASVGDTLPLTAASPIELEIAVDAPDWMPISEVELLADGEVIEHWRCDIQPRGARWFSHTLHVTPKRDTFYVVQARGNKELAPIYPGVWPWAITAPIFVNLGHASDNAPTAP
jgi:hypothetical protein